MHRRRAWGQYRTRKPRPNMAGALHCLNQYPPASAGSLTPRYRGDGWDGCQRRLAAPRSVDVHRRPVHTNSLGSRRFCGRAASPCSEAAVGPGRKRRLLPPNGLTQRPIVVSQGVECGVIGVWVADPMLAYSLCDSPVVVPVDGLGHHVVAGEVVHPAVCSRTRVVPGALSSGCHWRR